MDLTRSFPRSPKATLSGLVMVPRMIDKARAFVLEKLGEYIYPCPLDRIVLEFLEVEAEEFARLAGTHPDREIALWVDKKCGPRSRKEKKDVNKRILQRSPDTEDKLKQFMEIRDKIDPTRTDVTTWVDLLDLDENRLPPKTDS